MFRKIRPTLLAVLLLAGVSLAAGELRAGEIRWKTSAKQAQDTSQQSGQPLLIYVGADYCGYCRKLERTTWVNDEVAARVQAGFIPLKVDGQRSTQIVRQLGVRGFPAMILLSPEGVVLRKQEGYLDAREMLNFLQSARQSRVSRSVVER